MTNSEVLKKLKLINEIKPDQEWLASNRADLLLKIKDGCHQKTEKKSLIKIPAWLEFDFGFIFDLLAPRQFASNFSRPFVSSILGALILLGSISSIGATQSSLPGDILYPVKIASENLQLAFTKNVEDKTRLEMKFAGVRISELNKLAANNQLTVSELDEKVGKLTFQLEENISTVNEHLAKLSEANENGQALKVAQDVDQKIAEYAVALNKISKVPAASTKMSKVLNKVEETGDKALAVIVAKRETGAAADAEIAAKLNSKIADVVGLAVDGEVEQFAEASDLVKKGDYAAALSKYIEGKDIVKSIRKKMEAGNKEITEIKKLKTEDKEDVGGDEKLKTVN